VLGLINPVTGTELLPSQCQGELTADRLGNKLQPFSQFAPRLSATYDLMGNGKTQIHSSYSLYYSTKITLANALGNLGAVTLSWGNMANSGACSGSSTSCWQDLNFDGFVQANELSWVSGGIAPGVRPPSGGGSFNRDTGQLQVGLNTVDKSAKIGRTREAIVGMQHELIPNLAVGVDYVYRNYDRGTATYSEGLQPGCETSTTIPCVGPGFPIYAIYTVRNTYTDPVTGISAPYYTATPGTIVPTGLPSITMTSLDYTVYRGVILQATKRFSDRWQMNTSVTLQRSNPFDVYYTNPTGREFNHNHSSLARYLFKMSGAYALPYGLMVSGNLNINDGANRGLSIDGPGDDFDTGARTPGGNAIEANYSELDFQNNGTTRLKAVKLLDMGVSKTFALRGGKNRLKVMVDAFNLFNINTITDWESDNRSEIDFTAPSRIVPPRVIRFGMTIGF
jgi:hypothetical protein